MEKGHLGPQLRVWIMQVSLFSSVHINRFNYFLGHFKHQLIHNRSVTTQHVLFCYFEAPLISRSLAKHI